MCVYELWHNWPIEYIPTHPLLLNNSCIQCGEGGMGMNIFDLSIIPKFIHILPVLYNHGVISAGLFWFLICWASKIRQKGKKSLIFWPKNPDHYWVHVTRYCVEDFFSRCWVGLTCVILQNSFKFRKGIFIWNFLCAFDHYFSSSSKVSQGRIFFVKLQWKMPNNDTSFAVK